MTPYAAPLRDMHFVLDELAGLDRVAALPSCAEAGSDLVAAILGEAAKFAAGVLAPLNRPGDVQGCRLEAGRVTTPDGWAEAWTLFAEAGWLGLALPSAAGGQGLPKLLATPVWEMWFSANMAFAMLPQLNAAQAEALIAAASEAQKAFWLPRIVSGRWACTMNLTEAQAGSDLAATRTRAEAEGDGSYRLFGQKIFISYGEHELAENIVHLVLARLPGAPLGSKGLSLFIVPKYLANPDGSLGARNDVHCIAIERKLGIHGSPTCTLNYGERGGAVGYLVGAEHRGLEIMFVMMNESRFAVGVQGLALAERAWQAAHAFARERIQGRDAVTGQAGVPIIRHPDVQRMLLGMRAGVMAMRALLYSVAGWFDLARHHADPAVAERHRRYVDLLMPVVKGWCTELGNEICHEAIQVFGGMGVVEESGVAQYCRDARVMTLYEGTTGIQANDLVDRKILRDRGATLRELVAEQRAVAGQLAGQAGLAPLGQSLTAQLAAIDRALERILILADQAGHRQAVAVPFLRLLGIVCASWQMARAALAAQARLDAGEGAAAYLEGVIALARFHFAHRAPQALAHAETVAIDAFPYPAAALTP